MAAASEVAQVDLHIKCMWSPRRVNMPALMALNLSYAVIWHIQLNPRLEYQIKNLKPFSFILWKIFPETIYITRVNIVHIVAGNNSLSSTTDGGQVRDFA